MEATYGPTVKVRKSLTAEVAEGLTVDVGGVSKLKVMEGFTMNARER